jgi:hypothetical protein
MMSKHFEEARLVITADIVYDPDEVGGLFLEEIERSVMQLLRNLGALSKNENAELKGFICDEK